MSLLTHAERELRLAGMHPDGDSQDPNTWVANCVLHLMSQFANQGHSGSSMGYVIKVFEKLARFEPLSPLQGTDDEWTCVAEPSGYPLWQNKRCSHVFKDETGAYDIDGRVFREQLVDEDGPYTSCYTNKDSRVAVTFPYTPKTEYVDVKPSDQTPTR